MKKLAKCPACKAEIDHLECFEKTDLQGIYYPYSGFSETMGGSIEMNKWACPACHEELDIDDQGVADNFLAGKFAMLTATQRDKYIEDPGHCPVCGKAEGVIDGGDLEFDRGSIIQEMTCPECQAQWHDIYTLTSVHARGEP